MAGVLGERDRLQLADLIELAGTAAAVQDVVAELTELKGARPSLQEAVNGILLARRGRPPAEALGDAFELLLCEA